MLARLDPTTKIDPDWSRLVELRDLGRAAAEDWLAARHGGGRAGPTRRRPTAPRRQRRRASAKG